MRTQTKIVCTIGPAVSSRDQMEKLLKAGMNVARLNFSHGTYPDHLKIIENLKDVRESLNVPLAIMLDTKGPEIRLGKIEQGSMDLSKGMLWRLMKSEALGNEEQVSIHPPEVLDCVEVGSSILFDDGYISSKVLEIHDDHVLIHIENSGVIKSGKGVNIPNVRLNLPAVTEKDINDIRFACEQDLDVLAASFVRSAEHVMVIRKLLQDFGKPETLIIAKIENGEGVQNFEDILHVSDGIMIARGDLGVEVPLSRVPVLQKKMIRKCYLAGKASVTATQMLESMIHSPRPTRAEVSDVANAIYDSTSAVMLSGETAVGEYPIETVETMKQIIHEAENNFDYRQLFEYHTVIKYRDVPSSITLATVKTAYNSEGKAVFAFSSGGHTARLLSRLRPQMPIVALTPFKKTYQQLALSWGVVPCLKGDCSDVREAFHLSSQFAIEQNLVSYGDLVVVTAGSPFGVSGTTNMMLVENIGSVLVRGKKGCGSPVHGKLVFLLFPEDKRAYLVRDRIIVIPRYHEDFMPFIREASAIILQSNLDDKDSNELLFDYCEANDKTCIVKADGALTILQEGMLVTVDPGKAIVYKGVVL
jgi:pyruvate kinase